MTAKASMVLLQTKLSVQKPLNFSHPKRNLKAKKCSQKRFPKKLHGQTQSHQNKKKREKAQSLLPNLIWVWELKRKRKRVDYQNSSRHAQEADRRKKQLKISQMLQRAILRWTHHRHLDVIFKEPVLGKKLKFKTRKP